MQITVKTGGLLRDYLPGGGAGSQAMIDVPEGATPIDVMNQLGLPGEDTYLVMLNGAVLPTAERPQTTLKANDELGLFPPLKGG